MRRLQEPTIMSVKIMESKSKRNQRHNHQSSYKIRYRYPRICQNIVRNTVRSITESSRSAVQMHNRQTIFDALSWGRKFFQKSGSPRYLFWYKKSMLRIRVRDLVLFDSWIRDPGWMKNKDPDPVSGIRDEHPGSYKSESLETIFLG